MIRKVNNISVTPVPMFYSRNAVWNTIGKIVKISYIYDREKGKNGQSN